MVRMDVAIAVKQAHRSQAEAYANARWADQKNDLT